MRHCSNRVIRTDFPWSPIIETATVQITVKLPEKYIRVLEINSEKAVKRK